MKATGIIRRVDDLGRIVIPKEVRRSLRISEGEPMEVFIDEGGVVFKKYKSRLQDEARHLRELIDDYFEGEDRDDLLKALDEVVATLRKAEGEE